MTLSQSVNGWNACLRIWCASLFAHDCTRLLACASANSIYMVNACYFVYVYLIYHLVFSAFILCIYCRNLPNLFLFSLDTECKFQFILNPNASIPLIGSCLQKFLLLSHCCSCHCIYCYSVTLPPASLSSLAAAVELQPSHWRHKPPRPLSKRFHQPAVVARNESRYCLDAKPQKQRCWDILLAIFDMILTIN